MDDFIQMLPDAPEVTYYQVHVSSADIMRGDFIPFDSGETTFQTTHQGVEMKLREFHNLPTTKTRVEVARVLSEDKYTIKGIKFYMEIAINRIFDDPAALKATADRIMNQESLGSQGKNTVVSYKNTDWKSIINEGSILNKDLTFSNDMINKIRNAR